MEFGCLGSESPVMFGRGGIISSAYVFLPDGIPVLLTWQGEN